MHEYIPELKEQCENGTIGLPFWRSFFQAGDKRIKGHRVHPTAYLLVNDAYFDS